MQQFHAQRGKPPEAMHMSCNRQMRSVCSQGLSIQNIILRANRRKWVMHLRSAPMMSGDLMMAHSAKWARCSVNVRAEPPGLPT